MSKDNDIINLSSGDPNFDTPAHICQAAADAAARGETHYPPRQGLPQLREAIAARYQDKYGVAVRPSEVQVTNGAANALFVSIHSLVEPGDRVVILQPTLGYITNQVILAGGEVVSLWLENGTSLLALESELDRALAQARMLIVNFPSNPGGRLLTEPEFELVSRLVQKHDCYLLSDEVYDGIIFDDQPLFTTFWGIDSEKVIVVNSFSKTYAMTGWRLGYVIAPEPIRETITRCFGMAVSHINVLAQHAGVAALTQSQDCVAAMVKEYKARRDFFAQGLSEMPALNPWYPQAGLYFFVDISTTGYDSVQVCQMLLEQAKVFVVPGEAFGPEGDRFIRVTFARTPIPLLERTVQRMDRFFHQLTGDQ
jgi:aspartate/methionine/tyrosine aminotransferase